MPQDSMKITVRTNNILVLHSVYKVALWPCDALDVCNLMRSTFVRTSSSIMLILFWLFLCLGVRSSYALELGYTSSTAHPNLANAYIGYRLIAKDEECDIGNERKIYGSSGDDDCYWSDWDNEAHRCYALSSGDPSAAFAERCAKACAWSMVGGEYVNTFIVKYEGSDRGRCWCETHCYLQSSSARDGPAGRTDGSTITSNNMKGSDGYYFFAFECQNGFGRSWSDRGLHGQYCDECPAGKIGGSGGNHDGWENKATTTYNEQSVQHNEAIHCQSCAGGEFTDAVRSVSCKDCGQGAVGFYSVTKIHWWPFDYFTYDDCASACTECLACGPGTKSAAKASTCTNCVVGEYQTNSNQGTCETCDDSQKTDGDGKHFITDCKCNVDEENDGNNHCKERLRQFISRKTSNTGSFEVSGVHYLNDDDFFCDAGYEPLVGVAAVAKSECKACRAGRYKKIVDDALCLECADIETNEVKIHEQIDRIHTTTQTTAPSTSEAHCRCAEGKFYSEDLCQDKLYSAGTPISNLQFAATAPTGFTEYAKETRLSGDYKKITRLRRCKRNTDSDKGTFNYDNNNDDSIIDKWFILQEDEHFFLGLLATVSLGKVYTTWNYEPVNNLPNAWILSDYVTTNTGSNPKCIHNHNGTQTSFAFENNCPGQLQDKWNGNFPPETILIDQYTDFRTDSLTKNCHLHTTDNILRCCNACPHHHYKESIPDINTPDKCTRCGGDISDTTTFSRTQNMGNTRESDCECPQGYYSDNANHVNTCTECPPGTFREEADRKTFCRGCARNNDASAALNSGTWDADADSLPDHGVKRSISRDACKCNKGYYSETDTNYQPYRCAGCPVGKYKSNTGNDGRDHSTRGCLVCPDDHYTESIATVSCTVCPTSGSVQTNTIKTTAAGAAKTAADHDQRSDCYCPPGKYGKMLINIRSSGSTACTDCPTNSFKHTHWVVNQNSLQTETSTQNGVYTNLASVDVVGSKLTTPSGTISDCLHCPPGTELKSQGGDNPNQCIRCPVGKYKLKDKTDSSVDKSGHPSLVNYYDYRDREHCQECMQGKYEPSEGYYADTCSGTCSFDGNHGQNSNFLGRNPAYTSTTASLDLFTYSIEGSFTYGLTVSSASIMTVLGGNNVEFNGPEWVNTSRTDWIGIAGRGRDSPNDCLCTPGYTKTSDLKNYDDFCVRCGTGTYKEGFGDAVCDSCPAGKFTEATGTRKLVGIGSGSDEVKGCQPVEDMNEGTGKYTNKGSNVLEKCPAGSYMEFNHERDGIDECEPCQTGQYQDEDSTSVCKQCPFGKLSNHTFADRPRDLWKEWTHFDSVRDCTPCPAGTFGLDCTPCPHHEYASGEGNTYCEKCPAGTSTNRTGSTSREDCRNPCEKGQFVNDDRQCENCMAGKYELGGRCYHCPAGYTSLFWGSVACEACPVGTHWTKEISEIATVLHDSSYGGKQNEREMLRSGAPTKWYEYGSWYMGDLLDIEQPDGLEPCLDWLKMSGIRSTDKIGESCTQLCHRHQMVFDVRSIYWTELAWKFSATAQSESETFSETIKKNILECPDYTWGENQEFERNICESSDYFDVTIKGIHPKNWWGACEYETGNMVVPSFQNQSSHKRFHLFHMMNNGSNPPHSALFQEGVCAEYENCVTEKDIISYDNGTGYAKWVDLVKDNYADYQPINHRRICQCSKQDKWYPNCQTCSAGKYSPVTAGLVCLDCPAGKTHNNTRTGCVDCEAGQYARDSGNGCLDCETGTYSASQGATMCQSCLPGTYANETSSTGCTWCDSGKYAQRYGEASCGECDNTDGQYGVRFCRNETQGQAIEDGGTSCTSGTDWELNSVDNEDETFTVVTENKINLNQYATDLYKEVHILNIGTTRDIIFTCKKGANDCETGLKRVKSDETEKSFLVEIFNGLSPDSLNSQFSARCNTVCSSPDGKRAICLTASHIVLRRYDDVVVHTYAMAVLHDNSVCSISETSELFVTTYRTGSQQWSLFKFDVSTRIDDLELQLSLTGSSSPKIACSRNYVVVKHGNQDFCIYDQNFNDADVQQSCDGSHALTQETIDTMLLRGTILFFSTQGQLQTYNINKNEKSQVETDLIDFGSVVPVFDILTVNIQNTNRLKMFVQGNKDDNSFVYEKLLNFVETVPNDCTDCPVGEYQPKNTPYDPECKKCPPGSYQSEEGKMECQLCDPGTYQSDEGRSSCLSCEIGFYSMSGSTACAPCPTGTGGDGCSEVYQQNNNNCKPFHAYYWNLTTNDCSHEKPTDKFGYFGTNPYYLPIEKSFASDSFTGVAASNFNNFGVVLTLWNQVEIQLMHWERAEKWYEGPSISVPSGEGETTLEDVSFSPMDTMLVVKMLSDNENVIWRFYNMSSETWIEEKIFGEFLVFEPNDQMFWVYGDNVLQRRDLTKTGDSWSVYCDDGCRVEKMTPRQDYNLDFYLLVETDPWEKSRVYYLDEHTRTWTSGPVSKFPGKAPFEITPLFDQSWNQMVNDTSEIYGRIPLPATVNPVSNPKYDDENHHERFNILQSTPDVREWQDHKPLLLLSRDSSRAYAISQNKSVVAAMSTEGDTLWRNVSQFPIIDAVEHGTELFVHTTDGIDVLDEHGDPIQKRIVTNSEFYEMDKAGDYLFLHWTCAHNHWIVGASDSQKRTCDRVCPSGKICTRSCDAGWYAMSHVRVHMDDKTFNKYDHQYVNLSSPEYVQSVNIDSPDMITWAVKDHGGFSLVMRFRIHTQNMTIRNQTLFLSRDNDDEDHPTLELLVIQDPDSSSSRDKFEVVARIFSKNNDVEKECEARSQGLKFGTDYTVTWRYRYKERMYLQVDDQDEQEKDCSEVDMDDYLRHHENTVGMPPIGVQQNTDDWNFQIRYAPVNKKNPYHEFSGEEYDFVTLPFYPEKMDMSHFNFTFMTKFLISSAVLNENKHDYFTIFASAEQYNDETNSLQLFYDKDDHHVHAKTQFGSDENELECDSYVKLETEIWYMALWTLKRFQRFSTGIHAEEITSYEWIQELTITNLENKNETNHRIHCNSYDGKDLPGNRPTFAVLGMPVMSSLHEDHHKFLGRISGVHWYMEILTEAQITAVFDSILASDGVSVSNYAASDNEERCVIFEESTETTQVAVDVVDGDDSTVAFNTGDNKNLDVYALDYIVRSEETAQIAFEDVVDATTVQVAVFYDPSFNATVAYEDIDSAPTFQVAAIESDAENHQKTLECVNTKLHSTFIAYQTDEIELTLSDDISSTSQLMSACNGDDNVDVFYVNYGDLLIVGDTAGDYQIFEIIGVDTHNNDKTYTFNRLSSVPNGLPKPDNGDLITTKDWESGTKVTKYRGKEIVSVTQIEIKLFESLHDLQENDFIYIEPEYMEVIHIGQDQTTLTVDRDKTPVGRSGTHVRQTHHHAGVQVFLVKNGIGADSTQVFLNSKMDDLQKFDYLKSVTTGEYMKVIDISDTKDLVDGSTNLMANITVMRGSSPAGLTKIYNQRVLAEDNNKLILVRQRKRESDTRMRIYDTDNQLSVNDYLKRKYSTQWEYLKVTHIDDSKNNLKDVTISRNQVPPGLQQGIPLNMTHDDDLVKVLGGLTSVDTSIRFKLVTPIQMLHEGDYLKTPDNEYLNVTVIENDGMTLNVTRKQEPLGLTQGEIDELKPGTVVTLAETTIDASRTTINIVDVSSDDINVGSYLKTSEDEYVKVSSISSDRKTLNVIRGQNPAGLTGSDADIIAAGSDLTLVMGGLQDANDATIKLVESIPDLDQNDFLQVGGNNYLKVTSISNDGKEITVTSDAALIMPGRIVTLAEGQIKNNQNNDIEIHLNLKTDNPDDNDVLDVGDILKFSSSDSSNKQTINYFEIISINTTTDITKVNRLNHEPNTGTLSDSAFTIAVETETKRVGGDIHTGNETITLSAGIAKLQINDYLRLDGGEFVQVTQIGGDNSRTITVSRDADPPGQTKPAQKRVKSGKKVQRYAGEIAKTDTQVLVSDLSSTCEVGDFIQIAERNEYLEITECDYTNNIIKFEQNKFICGFSNGDISEVVPAGENLTYYRGGLKNESTDTVLKIANQFDNIREGDYLRTGEIEYLLVISINNEHSTESHITVRRAQQPPGIESTTNPKRIRVGSTITLPGGSNEKEFLHGVVYGLYAFDTFLEPEPAAVVANAIIKNEPDLFSGGIECKRCPWYMQHSPPNSVHQKSCFVACGENEKAVQDDPFLINFNPNQAEWKFESDDDAKTYNYLPWQIQEKGGLTIVTQLKVDNQYFDRMDLIKGYQVTSDGAFRDFFLRLEREVFLEQELISLHFQMRYYLEADANQRVIHTCNNSDSTIQKLRGNERLVECNVHINLGYYARNDDYYTQNCMDGKFCNVSMVYSRGSAQTQGKPQLTILVDDLEAQTQNCDPDPCDNMFDFDFKEDTPTETFVGGGGFEGEFRGLYAVNGKLQPESIDRIFYGIRESYDNEQWLREFENTKTKCESCERGLTSHRHSTECFHPQSLPLEGSTVYHQFMAMNTDALGEPYLATLHEPKVNFLPYQEEYHGYEVSEKTYFQLNEVDGDWYAVVFASLRQNDTAATAPFLIISNIETERISFDQPKSERHTEIAMISDFVFFHDQFTTTNFHYVVAILEDTKHDEKEFFVLFERVIYENHPKIYTQHTYELRGIENRNVKRGKVLHNKQGMFVFVLYEPERSDSNSSVFAIRGQYSKPYETGNLELIRIETSKFLVYDDTALFAHEEMGNSTVLFFTMIDFYDGLQEFMVSFADGSGTLHLITRESMFDKGDGHLIAIPDLQQRFFWSYELLEMENDDENERDFVLQNAKRWETCQETCDRERSKGFRCMDDQAIGSMDPEMKSRRKEEVQMRFPDRDNDDYTINLDTGVVAHRDALFLEYNNKPVTDSNHRLRLSSTDEFQCDDYISEDKLHLRMSVCVCRKRKQTVRMRLIDADTGKKYAPINVTLENGVKPVQSVVVQGTEMVLTVMSDGNVYQWFYKKQKFALSLDDFRHYLGLGGSVQSDNKPDNSTYVISDRKSEAIVLSNLQHPPLKLGKIVKEAFDHMVVGTKQELMVYRAHDDSTSWERDVFARVEFTRDSIQDYALSADGSRVYVLLASGKLQVRSLKSWYKRCPENAFDDQTSLYECRCDQDHYWVSSYAYETSENLTYQHPVSGECNPCPGNSTADPGSTVCTCADGFEYDFDNQKCDQCEEGYFKLTPGNEPCQQCPVGFFCPGLGGSKEECPDDHYAEPASGVCTLCPEHSTTLFTGAKRNIQDCTCRAGFYGRRGEPCMPCPGSVDTTLDYTGYDKLEHFEIGQESYAAMCHCKLGSEAMHASKDPDNFDIGCRICGSNDFGPLEVPVQLTKLQRIMPTFTAYNREKGWREDIGADSGSTKEYEPFSLSESGRIAFLLHVDLDVAWSFQVVFEATFTHAASAGDMITSKWRLSQRRTFSGEKLFNFQIFDVESSGTQLQLCKVALNLDDVAPQDGTALAIQYDHVNKKLLIASMQKKIEGEREFKHTVFEPKMAEKDCVRLQDKHATPNVQSASFTVGTFEEVIFLKGRVTQFYFIGHSLNTNPANDLEEYTRALIHPEFDAMDKVTAYRTNCTVCAGNTTSTLQPTSDFDIGCTCKKGFRKYTSDGLAKKCSFCEIGTYKDEESDSECFQCPQNETTLEPGADDIDKCICASGFHSNNTEHENEACISCIMGKYNPNKKQTECLPCESNEYQDLRHQVGCKQCPKYSSHDETLSALPQDCLCDSGHEYYLLYPPAVLRDRHNFSHPEYPTQYDEILWGIKEHGGLLASFAIRVDSGQFPQSIMDFEGDLGERIKIALTGNYKVRVDLKIFEDRACSFDHTFEPEIKQNELYFVQMWIEQKEFGNGTRISLKVESNATEVDMEPVDSTLACQGSFRDIQTTKNVIAPRSLPSKEKTDWAGRLSGIYLFDRPMNEAERQHILSRTKTGTRKTLRVSGAMYAMQDYNATSGLVHVKSEDRYYNDMMSYLTNTFNYDVELDTLFDHPGQSETSFLVTRTEHCNFCPPGKFSNTTSGLCTNCEQGTYNNQKAQMSCEKCEMGKHQEQTGQTVCKWCSAGTYAQRTGLPECTHCARGKYGIVDNSTTELNCKLCDLGQYQNETGQSSCYSCGDNSTTSQLGAKEFYECGCDKGYKWGSCNPSKWMDLIPRCFDPRSKYDKNEKNCQCDAGRYKDQTVDSDIRGPCQACAPGKISKQGAYACESCLMGSRDEERKECVMCENGTFSFNESSNCIVPENITSAINATLTYTFFDADTSSSQGSGDLGPFTEIFNITSAILQAPVLIFDLTIIEPPKKCQEYCRDRLLLENNQKTQDSQCECTYPQEYTSTVLGHAVFNKHQKIATVTHAIQNCGDNEQSQDSACVCVPGFTPDTNRVCRACPAGKYKEIYGPNKCRNCPAGTASNGTASKHRHDCSVCQAGTYATGGNSVCSKCSAGKFNPDLRSDSVDSCRICEVAKYTATSGESACTDCTLGTWSNTSESASEENCQKCLAGKYSDTELSTTQDNCKNCGYGKYSLIGSATCTDCRAGTFNQKAGQSTCKNCSAGWFVDYKGAHSCKSVGTPQDNRCEKGTFSLSGASACSSCPAGKFNDHLNASTCNDCSVGFYSAYDGATGCGLCPNGTVPSAERSTCKNCTAGTFSEYPANECQNCSAGFYSAYDGATGCGLCANGTVPNSLKISCVACDAGKYSAYPTQECQDCDGDTYSSNTGQTRCEDCWENSQSTADKKSCECADGYFENEGACVSN